eukprot:SAG22_NODE_89_length_21278_cov_16.698758_14_plen_154_part_00
MCCVQVGFDGSQAGGGYAVSAYLDAGIPFRFLGVGWPRSDDDLPDVLAPTSEFIARFDNYTAATTARNDSGGGWGAAGFGGWTRESVWTRRMVLTAEGALIVLDRLQTSEQAVSPTITVLTMTWSRRLQQYSLRTNPSFDPEYFLCVGIRSRL